MHQLIQEQLARESLCLRLKAPCTLKTYIRKLDTCNVNYYTLKEQKTCTFNHTSPLQFCCYHDHRYPPAAYACCLALSWLIHHISVSTGCLKGTKKSIVLKATIPVDSCLQQVPLTVWSLSNYCPHIVYTGQALTY